MKRMLAAYSSIAHAGYILVGFVRSKSEPEMALSAVFYYLMAYTVSNVLAFGSLIWLEVSEERVVSYGNLVAPVVVVLGWRFHSFSASDVDGFPSDRGVREILCV
ncbi:MAG: proton-conducting transporter membrane subunit [Polyangiales bacterium]